MKATTYPNISQKVVITDDALMEQVKLARQAEQPLRAMSSYLREFPWRHGNLHSNGGIQTCYDDTEDRAKLPDVFQVSIYIRPLDIWSETH